MGQLKQAIAAGLVPGFGNLGSRVGRRIDTSAEDMAAAKAAADKAAAEARARAAAEERARAAAAAAAAAEAAAARSSQLELAEQACIAACRNLAGQCRHNLF